MSILQQVIEEYGISEMPEALTDKTAKRVKSPEALTDKTAKSPSVSSVSEWSEGLRIKSEDDTPFGKLATATTHRPEWSESPLVQSVDQWSKRLRQAPDELRRAAGDDWDEVSNDPAQLVAFADSLAISQIRESGAVPDTYVSATTCQKCGPVPIWPGCPPKVTECPWCMNGLTAPPILGVKK